MRISKIENDGAFSMEVQAYYNNERNNFICADLAIKKLF